ncbi:bleomycin resistance protein [Rubellimicrobium roseum]|uniref:Bleomycin resistance protein n=1 Tax=Rubellimicrobium roseum TaxID=687525 RepID=A0A5C4NJ28_9RHOB|nr:bleomycin resistance protein [Rubellimicrobium roseum]TNC74623.1 bleomycin resistance protein [Rubellimicrobium roseum]
MRERITANLPARSLDAAQSFYARLGFETEFRDEGWLILRRGPLELEIFPHPGLDPATSAASACVRVADADRLHADWSATGLPAEGIPRLTAPEDQPFGWRVFALVDPDGNLLRCLSPLGMTTAS